MLDPGADPTRALAPALTGANGVLGIDRFDDEHQVVDLSYLDVLAGLQIALAAPHSRSPPLGPHANPTLRSQRAFDASDGTEQSLTAVRCTGLVGFAHIGEENQVLHKQDRQQRDCKPDGDPVPVDASPEDQSRKAPTRGLEHKISSKHTHRCALG